MAGYSGTPLPQKLGIKEGHHVAILDAPSCFDKVLGTLPTGTMVAKTISSRAKSPPLFDVSIVHIASCRHREHDPRRRVADRPCRQQGVRDR